MYFPIGWPKTINLVGRGTSISIRQIVCNRDKILFAILTDDSLYIYFCKPCLPIVCHTRNAESVEDLGPNELVQWRPDSSMLVVVTSSGSLVFYRVAITSDHRALYEQIDSPQPNLRRDSAELFIKEVIPPLHLSVEHITGVEGGVRSLVCIRDELMLATTRGHVLRYRWDGQQNRDYSLDLRRVPFCLDQQVTKAVPLTDQNTYIIDIEYSPLVGGFAVVLNDGRAAFLTASSLRFDPNQVQGIWAPGVNDATCASVNHKYRLLVFGRSNSQCVVFTVDESSGGLEVSHRIVLSSKDYPGAPGGVSCIRWTPDASAMAVSWERGGVSLWSTFGALLMCTLGWDYGLHVDLSRANPLIVGGLEWCAEGYQLWMIRRRSLLEEEEENTHADSLIQLEFVKSPLTVNPCMSLYGHLFLQGEDKLYINLADSPGGINSNSSANNSLQEASGNSKQWLVVPIPSAYSGTNWPIRYTAIDAEAQALAVAGRTGLAHYSLLQRKWKLFGNETQEKDFVVTGGLLWWQDYVLAGCYSIPDDRDEIRVYPREAKLDRANMTSTRLTSQALLLNLLRDRLIAFCADAQLAIFRLCLRDNQPTGAVELIKLQSVDVTALCVHPACVTSVTLTSLRPEAGARNTSTNNPGMNEASILINVSGRLLMVQHESDANTQQSDNNANREHLYTCVPATVLASCVEHVWVPGRSRRDKLHLTEALWLYCGAHGMRVWLPLWPRGDSENKTHTFMAKRIMLPFQLKIYPLAILFEDAILLGAENDTILYTSDSNSPFSLPYCVLEKTSQVYLHQILRQLIRRNLGYHAWEIARSCTGLPYFPHSLELLLHEVLEEEATSKEPIPDALLPSVIEFIQEFPVYLQTVVQCARKTEIALWPYLFAAAGKPKALFQECLSRNQLDTAASYLIILQNLEPASVSRQHATLLLDAALTQSKWELSKELVRFLRAIDPNDAESPRASFVLGATRPVQTPTVGPNEEDLALVLGTMQVSRGRSFSTTISPKLSESVTGTVSGTGLAGSLSGSSDVRSQTSQKRKKSVPTRTDSSISSGETPYSSAEDFFLDVILQRHARRLLSTQRIADLGYFAAHLDFHLVSWLARERDRAARIDDPIATLKRLHLDFKWPYPQLTHPVSYYLQRKSSQTSSLPSTPTVDEPLTLGDVPTTGSRVGDSGYMSFPGGISAPTGIPEYHGNGHLVEAHLMPHLLQDDRSVFSDDTCAASLWGDDLPSPTTVMNPPGIGSGPSSLDRWTGQAPSPLLLEQLAQEMSARGSPKAEVQLRYLFQLVLEAGCLEWALLIAIVLRDALAVFRTTTAVRAAEQSCESIARLREALATFCQWSAVECLGYKPFMVAVQSQLGHLAKLLSTKQAIQQQAQQLQQHQQHSPSSPSAPGSDSPTISRRSRQTSTSHDGIGSTTVTNLTNELTRLSVSESTASGTTEEAASVTFSDPAKQMSGETRENDTNENGGCVVS